MKKNMLEESFHSMFLSACLSIQEQMLDSLREFYFPEKDRISKSLKRFCGRRYRYMAVLVQRHAYLQERTRTLGCHRVIDRIHEYERMRSRFNQYRLVTSNF